VRRDFLFEKTETFMYTKQPVKSKKDIYKKLNSLQ